MAPKWRYYIQNAILSGDQNAGWDINRKPDLADAANCAGVHVHAEIETLPEFLYFGRKLADKHNMGLMMTPKSSPSKGPIGP
jgi:hypothetical protein